MSVIKAFGFPFTDGPTGAKSTLTEQQREMVTKVLSGFDPDSLTATNAASIREAFRDAGIKPSRDLAQAITAEGFDPEALKANDSGP